MTRLIERPDVLIAGVIAVFGVGLLHCSVESVPTASSAGTSTGAGSGGEGSVGGNAPKPDGGSAGSATGGIAAGAAGGGGSASSTSGSGGAAGQEAMAAGAGGMSRFCGSGDIVCDDFEQHPAASAPAGGWTVSVRGDGRIVVDTARAFRGKQSLHVSGRMNVDRANISRPIFSDSLIVYVRFMMYATSYPASSGVHTRLMRIGTTDAASGQPDSSYSLAAYNGVAIEKVNSIYLRDTGTQFDDPSLMNRWKCWEFAIDKSGGVGNVEVQIWVDGEALSLSPAGSSSHGMTSPSWDPIPFELFMLGLDGFQADEQPADFWIDDLLVTPQRVGCEVAS